MKRYYRAVTSELLKLRRTLVLWLALLTPLLVHGLNICIALDQKAASFSLQDWPSERNGSFNMWLGLVLPLLIALEAGLLANMEYENNQWKHLFALPFPRGTLFAAKWSLGLLLIAASCLIFALGFPVSYQLLNILRPGVGYNFALPFGEILRLSGITFASLLLCFSLQTWVSLRWNNFILAMSIGVAADIINIGLLIGESTTNWFPWLFPITIYAGIVHSAPYLSLLLTASFGGLLVAALGGLEFIRQDVL